MRPFFYRIVRHINRYMVFTPEHIKNISSEIFTESADKYVGYPYVLGADGTSREVGVDCSHLISRALIDGGCMNEHFYRTARHLVKMTKIIESQEEVKKWDLLFLWDETGEIGHVAIITGYGRPHIFNILDASWPSTNLWITKHRDIDLINERYMVGRLFCIDYL